MPGTVATHAAVPRYALRVRRTLTAGLLFLAGCASGPPPIAAGRTGTAAETAGGEEVCTGSVSEIVVREVLGPVAAEMAEQPSRPFSAVYRLGTRMRVRADGRVDQRLMDGCLQQVQLFFECTENDELLSRIRFPPLESGECA